MGNRHDTSARDPQRRAALGGKTRKGYITSVLLVCDVEDVYGSLREGVQPLLPAARLEQNQAAKGDGVACTKSVVWLSIYREHHTHRRLASAL